MYSTIEAIQMLSQNPELKFKRYYDTSETYEDKKDLFCILSATVLDSCDNIPEVEIRRGDGCQVGLFLWESGFELMKEE